MFPSPGRAPRKTRKPPDTELLARLRRLEGVVQSLGKDVDGESGVDQKRSEVKEAQVLNSATNGGASENEKRYKVAGGGCRSKNGATTGLEPDFGRLVIEEGRSRYVSNSFWASLSDEVCVIDSIRVSVTESG